MTALSEALVAAQRRAIAALEKGYLAGQIDGNALSDELDRIGCADLVEQQQLLAALVTIKAWGASLPQASPQGNGISPDAPPALASDKQKAFIVRLLNEQNFPVLASQDLNALSKERAHKIIDALQSGTYDPTVWDVPFWCSGTAAKSAGAACCSNTSSVAPSNARTAGKRSWTKRMSGDPYPKARQLARGQRRYRRKVASPKQWQAIQAAKIGPCRICLDPASNGVLHGKVHMHHVIPRDLGGDDVPANIVPLCGDCHERVTALDRAYLALLELSLSPVERAYALSRRGRK